MLLANIFEIFQKTREGNRQRLYLTFPIEFEDCTLMRPVSDSKFEAEFFPFVRFEAAMKEWRDVKLA